MSGKGNCEAVRRRTRSRRTVSMWSNTARTLLSSTCRGCRPAIAKIIMTTARSRERDNRQTHFGGPRSRPAVDFSRLRATGNGRAPSFPESANHGTCFIGGSGRVGLHCAVLCPGTNGRLLTHLPPSLLALSCLFSTLLVPHHP